MSLSKDLCLGTIDRIAERFGLSEHGEPHMTLTSPMSPEPVGAARLWSGESVHKMVYIGLTVEQIRLDSHMLFAFTPPNSAVPHFTLDSVLAGPHFAFHLDLIPRVDMGAHLAYIDHTHHPLTETYDEAKELEGLSAAHLSVRQYAIMSPWMLAYRATEDAFSQINQYVDSYLSHWSGLVENPLPNEVLDDIKGVDFADRDRRNRAALFNAEVDPVWGQVAQLLGEEVSEQLRLMLQAQDVEVSA